MVGCGQWILLVQVTISNFGLNPGQTSYGRWTVVIEDVRPAIGGEKKEGKNSYESFWYVLYR